MKTLIVCVTALSMLLVLPATLQAQQTDLAALVKKLDAAYNAHDVATLSAIWLPDGVRQQIPAPPGTSGIAHGWTEILAQYQADWSQNARVEEIGEPQVNGNQVSVRGQYSDDAFTKMGVAPLEYTIVATFQGDKVQSVVVTLTPEAVAKLQAAMPAAMPATGAVAPANPFAALLVLGGLALVLGGLAVLTARHVH